MFLDSLWFLLISRCCIRCCLQCHWMPKQLSSSFQSFPLVLDVAWITFDFQLFCVCVMICLGCPHCLLRSVRLPPCSCHVPASTRTYQQLPTKQCTTATQRGKQHMAEDQTVPERKPFNTDASQIGPLQSCLTRVRRDYINYPVFRFLMLRPGRDTHTATCT